MKIQIKNRFDGKVIFETDATSLGDAVKAAIVANVNLSYANLSYANLRSANLSYADLSDANLSYANLRYANLSYANLRYANLSSADLSSADLSEIKITAKELNAILVTRTILPQGDLIGWKKLKGGVVCRLKIPAQAKRVGGLIGRKCRAEYAIVIEGEGLSLYNGAIKYKVGKTVKPDKFDPNPLVECSAGIHFFITREEAEAYSG